MTTPLTGAQYPIRAAGYAATVTGLGAGLRELTRDGKPLISAYDADSLPPHSAGQLLAPWPNRIEDGTYSFGGAKYRLSLSEPSRGNAIHGLTRWEIWEPDASEPDAVTLRCPAHGTFGYPFAVRVEATYRLTPADGLTVSVTATNDGSRPAPWGTAHHPYLAIEPPFVDECELTLPAGSWLPTGERGIPSGAPQPVAGTGYDFRTPRKIGATRLDNAFTGLARDPDGRAWVRLTGGGTGDGTAIGLWADASYGWVQVFTGDSLEPARRRTALAVEPMTCPPNAFASGTDLITLAPGQSVTHRWGLKSLS